MLISATLNRLEVFILFIMPIFSYVLLLDFMGGISISFFILLRFFSSGQFFGVFIGFYYIPDGG